MNIPAKRKNQTYATLRVIWPTDRHRGVALNHGFEPSKGGIVFARRRFHNRGIIKVDTRVRGLNRFILLWQRGIGHKNIMYQYVNSIFWDETQLTICWPLKTINRWIRSHCRDSKRGVHEQFSFVHVPYSWEWLRNRSQVQSRVWGHNIQSQSVCDIRPSWSLHYIDEETPSICHKTLTTSSHCTYPVQYTISNCSCTVTFPCPNKTGDLSAPHFF